MLVCIGVVVAGSTDTRGSDSITAATNYGKELRFLPLHECRVQNELKI